VVHHEPQAANPPPPDHILGRRPRRGRCLVLARGSAGAIEQATIAAIKREDTPAALLLWHKEPKQIPEMSRACRYGKWYGIWCGDGRQWLPMGLQRYSSQ